MKVVQSVSSRLYVGNTGTFHFGLPGEKEISLTGRIIRIVEGENWAAVYVLTKDGTRIGRI